jgi:thiamine biosynthesis lipoprotein
MPQSTTSSRKPPPELGAPWRFEAIGTVWQIDTERELAPALREAVSERIERFDRDWSRFRDDSLVTRIAREPGVYALPTEAADLLELYRALYDATDGAMSPLVGGALEALGYDRDYSLRPAPAPHVVPSWDDAIAWDGASLSTVRPVVVDIGAAGKGLLIDLVDGMLADAGIANAVVDAGGDLRRRGDGSIRVALEHPADATKAIGVVELGTGAICASATNRRAWAGVHHVVDALTGLPTRRVIATWALAESAMVADGAATALFFTDDPGLPGVEWLRILTDGRIERSAGFEGEVFT